MGQKETGTFRKFPVTFGPGFDPELSGTFPSFPELSGILRNFPDVGNVPDGNVPEISGTSRNFPDPSGSGLSRKFPCLGSY